MGIPVGSVVSGVVSTGSQGVSDAGVAGAKKVAANAVDVAANPVGVKKPVGTNAASQFDTAPAAPREETKLVAEKKTFLEALENPNYFGELDTPTEFVPSEASQAAANAAREALEGKGAAPLFFSGDVGRIHGARFINRGNRSDGDFRFAYGENAYRKWSEADAMLNAIPQGQLADKLDLDLIRKTGEMAFVKGEEPLMERIGHAFRELQGREIQPGQLRDYTTQTTPEKVLPADQIENIRALGLVYDELGIENGKGLAVIKYPEPREMMAQLDQLLIDTKNALKDPNSDIVTVAANFGQKFIALHPLQDLNGRVGRLLMDRILAERGVPPPIIKDTGADYSLSAAAYRTEIANGISRTIKATQRTPTLSGHAYMAEALRNAGVALPEVGELAPVRVNGVRYAQAADGFVYNEAGRPHLVDSKGVFQPLTQLQHYFAARRIFQSSDPTAALDSLTASTRKAFSEATATPEGISKLKFADDRPASAADNAYRLEHLPGELGNRYARLFDPTLSKPEVLFGTNLSMMGTKSSFTMSRHAQIDHELYLVQHAALDAGDQASAALVQGYREELFKQAKTALAGLKDESRVSPENPQGFTFGHEKIQYDNSLLRFDSFAEAERASGSKMIVFRGDSAAVQLTGIHPDGHFGHKDALDVGRIREEKGGTVNIFKDIRSVLGASGGTGYQSTTTDLGLLAKSTGFANKVDRIPVDLQALPGWLREAVKHRLQPGETLSVDSLRDVGMHLLTGRDIPQGHIDISGVEPQLLDDMLAQKCVNLTPEQQATLRNRIADARERAGETGFLQRILGGLSDSQVLVKLDDLFPESTTRITSLQDDISSLRDYLTIRRDPGNENRLNLASQRKAFLLNVDRNTGINAPNTLGNGQIFHGEQEITLFNTGLDATAPWNIDAVYTQAQLAKEFPVVKELPKTGTAAAPDKAPAAPAPSMMDILDNPPPSPFSEGSSSAGSSSVKWN